VGKVLAGEKRIAGSKVLMSMYRYVFVSGRGVDRSTKPCIVTLAWVWAWVKKIYGIVYIDKRRFRGKKH
jgi:hypothetical protein